MTHADWWAGKLASLEESLAEAILEAKAADMALPAGRAPYSEVEPHVLEAEREAEHDAQCAWERVGDIRTQIERHRELEHGTELQTQDRPGGSRTYVVPAGYDAEPSRWSVAR